MSRVTVNTVKEFIKDWAPCVLGALGATITFACGMYVGGRDTAKAINKAIEKAYDELSFENEDPDQM